MERPDPLAARLIAALADSRQTLATAESLTGGLIGARITGVPGSSAAYRGGVVAYATDLKHRLAGVPDDVLTRFGPVSEPTALALAAGVRVAAGSDWGLSATGVAGPDPQDGHAPGEVWVAVSGPDVHTAELHRFAGGRADVRDASVDAALRLLAAALHLR